MGRSRFISIKILRHTWEDEEKDVAKVIYYYKKATEYDGEWHKVSEKNNKLHGLELK